MKKQLKKKCNGIGELGGEAAKTASKVGDL